MRYRTSMLAPTLYEWLKNQREKEKKMGYTMDSGAVQSVQQLLDAIHKGERIIELYD